jgi:hypothetical protein
MKNVTITLPENTLQRARVAAAKQGKSLSRFVSDLVMREVDYDPEEMLRRLSKWFDGPGIPGISKVWEGREKLYAEREDQLLRRHERHRLHSGADGAEETSDRHEFAEKDDQQPYVDSKPAKPE